MPAHNFVEEEHQKVLAELRALKAEIIALDTEEVVRKVSKRRAGLQNHLRYLFEDAREAHEAFIVLYPLFATCTLAMIIAGAYFYPNVIAWLAVALYGWYFVRGTHLLIRIKLRREKDALADRPS